MKAGTYQKRLDEARELVGLSSGSWTVNRVLGYRLGRVEGRWVYKLDPIGVQDKGFYLQCKCNCGRTKEVRRGQLLNGKMSPCQWCSKLEERTLEITGQRFGRWTAIEHLGYKLPDGNYSTSASGVKDRNQYALCQCNCGKLGIVNEAHLMSGRSTQCKSCAATQRQQARRKEKEGEGRDEPTVITSMSCGGGEGWAHKINAETEVCPGIADGLGVKLNY